MVRSDVAENAFQRAEFDRAVVGNDFVMFAAFLGGDAQMQTGPTGDSVAKLTKGFGEFCAADVARRFHPAKTSSRTK